MEIGDIRALEDEQDPERRKALIARMIGSLGRAGREQVLAEIIADFKIHHFFNLWYEAEAKKDAYKFVWHGGYPMCGKCLDKHGHDQASLFVQAHMYQLGVGSSPDLSHLDMHHEDSVPVLRPSFVLAMPDIDEHTKRYVEYTDDVADSMRSHTNGAVWECPACGSEYAILTRDLPSHG